MPINFKFKARNKALSRYVFEHVKNFCPNCPSVEFMELDTAKK
jgi:hypothetical protein